MNTGHVSHTATLLRDGTVLVVGGFGGFSSAELYHPRSGAWTNTGTLNTGRLQDHTATLLRNGVVLVVGGLGCLAGPCVPVTSAEVYDPGNGTWTGTGSLNTARVGHTATLLQNGLVLVAGGLGPVSGVPLSSAELYDPKTGRWTITGSLNTAREGHTATLLPGGMVLVAGGSLGALSTAELYDPRTGIWTNTGSLNTGRARHTATLLRDGRVLVAGGAYGPAGVVSSAELYEPRTGTWTNTTAMHTPRYVHTATLLPNGAVLVAGGSAVFLPFPTVSLASAELYEPKTGTWTVTGSMKFPRSQPTATLLHNHTVLVAGGWNDIASAELFEPPH